MRGSTSAFNVLQKKFISHSLISHILLFLDYDEQRNVWNVPRVVLNNLSYLIMISSTMVRIPLLQHCSVSQLFVSRLSGGQTNDTFRIKIKNTDDVVLRLPKTSIVQRLISREAEAYNVHIAAQLGLNLEVLWQDAVGGHQLTRFLKGACGMAVQSILSNLPMVLEQFRALHGSPEKFQNTVDIFERNNQWLQQVEQPWPTELNDAVDNLAQSIEKIKVIWSQCELNVVPCHMDPDPSNFILFTTEDSALNCRLMDFEYAGNVRGGDVVDIAYLALCFPKRLMQHFVKQYLGEPSAFFESCVIVIQPVLLYWLSLWFYVSLTEQSDREVIREYQHEAKQFLNRALCHLESREFTESMTFLSEMKNKRHDSSAGVFMQSA